jgi:hypothetical protein
VVHHAGRLFQEWLVDAFAQVENNRLNFHRANQEKLRADLYNGLQDAISGGADLADIGQRIVLPSTFIGSPRHMTQQYHDAMAIVNNTSNPDLFITFTANPQWPEISEALLPGQTVQERPDLVSRVFKLKLSSICTELFEKHIFGGVRARMHVIEFQKRGLPHAHILLILHHDDKPKTIEDIDSIVCAELPDPIEQPHLYSVITRCMVHGPCGHAKPSARCMKDGRCSKHYPRPFSEMTIIDENSYPTYRRRNNGRFFIKDGFHFDNRWIVPYNPYLSAKYDAHINVEIATSITSVKYLYKYVYKGGDRATAEVQGEQELDNQERRDETRQYIDGRYLSSSEGKCFVLISNIDFYFLTLITLHSLLATISVLDASTQPHCCAPSTSPSRSAVRCVRSSTNRQNADSRKVEYTQNKSD